MTSGYGIWCGSFIYYSLRVFQCSAHELPRLRKAQVYLRWKLSFLVSCILLSDRNKAMRCSKFNIIRCKSTKVLNVQNSGGEDSVDYIFCREWYDLYCLKMCFPRDVVCSEWCISLLGLVLGKVWPFIHTCATIANQLARLPLFHRIREVYCEALSCRNPHLLSLQTKRCRMNTCSNKCWLWVARWGLQVILVLL